MAEGFHSLRVAEIVPETAEANSIRFEIPPELRDAFAFKAGQHLTLRATINGEEVRRNYSLCTAPEESELRERWRRHSLILEAHVSDGRGQRMRSVENFNDRDR